MVVQALNAYAAAAISSVNGASAQGAVSGKSGATGPQDFAAASSGELSHPLEAAALKMDASYGASGAIRLNGGAHSGRIDTMA